MNFIEAVTELKEGRCRGIKRAEWNNTVFVRKKGYLYDEWDGCPAFTRMDISNFTADDWLLVDPQPVMETVDLACWAIVAPSGYVETTSSNESLQRSQISNENSPFYGYRVVELSGTYQREVKPKTKHSTIWEDIEWKEHDNTTLVYPCGGSGSVYYRDLIGRKGRLIFEWED